MIPFFILNVGYWILGLDDGTALLAFFNLVAFISLFWVSRKKSVKSAIFLFSIVFVLISFSLSIGWGVSDIATNAVYVMTITQISLLLRRWRFALVLGILF